jgi:ribosome recycling factor
MNFIYSTLINKTENKMAGYMALLDFRYQNLCVMAEPGSLLPVTVIFGSEEKNIEDVADVAQPDDYHLAVIPKSPITINQIAQSIMKAHPEFKMKIQQMEVLGDKKDYLEYEMPEVDKDRRDFLNQTVKSLHDEAKVRIDEIYVEAQQGFAEYLEKSPEDLDEVNKAIDKAHDDYIIKIRDLRDKKLEEVEEGYQRYLQHAQEEAEAQAEDPGYDVTKGMRMTEE